MRYRSALCLGAALLAACPPGRAAPPGWNPTPEEATHRVHGHWVNVAVYGGPDLSGELIAVSSAGLFVALGDELWRVPGRSIESVEVVVHDGDAKLVWAWVGLLSTPSHGFYLLITGPVWLLGGVAGAAYHDHGGSVFASDDDELLPLRKYARFPQGLPEAFGDRAGEWGLK